MHPQSTPINEASAGRPARETNVLAIISLAFGIIGGFPFAAVLGIVALVQIRRRGQRGFGLAVAGLILAAVWFVVIAVLGVLFVRWINEGSPERSYTVGECLNDLEGDRTTVPCSEPHDGEVFKIFDLAAGPYPGDESVEAQAKGRCRGEFGSYLKNSQDVHGLGVFTVWPASDRWSDDRSVICIGYDPDGPLTGSLRD